MPFRFYFVVVAASLIAGPATPKPVPVRTVKPTVVVDSEALSTSSTVFLVDKIASKVPDEKWPTTALKDGDTLYGVVERLYRLSDGERKRAADAYALAIAKHNDIDDPDDLQAIQCSDNEG